MQYYKEDVSAVLKELNTTEEGLSGADAELKLDKYGYNELDTKTKINKLKLFIEQFKSFIIYILLFAVAFSVLVGEYIDAVIILIILMANALIGYFQELSAQKSLEALRKLSTLEARVLRDGKVIIIDSKYLVPGDIIILEAGDKVPADCRVISETRLKIQESALTGESLSVFKQVEKITKDVQIGDQKNMLFSSTAVTEGVARAVVVETGMKTEIGKITKLIKDADEEMTPLQIKLDDFGKKLGYIILLICALIFFVTVIKDYFTTGLTIDIVLAVILIAISLAVAAVPEGLPAVVTVALSVGVKRLLKKKALVRKLSSVETLGSCNIICSDKTGTLTKNEMTVKQAWVLGELAELDGVGYNPVGAVSKHLGRLIYDIGATCNNATLDKKDNVWKITGDPTEAALLVSAKKNHIEDNSKRIDEIPFDSSRKLMSVLVDKKGKLFTYTKGAPDRVLEHCTHIMKDGKKVKLTPEMKKEVMEQNSKFAKEAMRVLAFAYKETKSKKDFSEKDLVFVGLQAMIDPPRPDVIDSIRRTKEAGIRVIMITGDYKETAQAIGEHIGIRGNALTGIEVDKMSDKELEKALENNTNIFARVVPEHKQRIVSILQDNGNIVAMTGDGVNDAPALKKANIGVAVGSGTDVAKEAADFVLLDDSFTNIVNAIEEGRGIYDNIQKVILHLLSGNLAEVLIIFLAVLLDFNLPLTAILLLWINLITDGAPALALSVDPYNSNIMKRKPIKASQGIMSKKWWYFISYLGIITTIIALFMFSYFGGNSNDEALIQSAQTVVFTFIVITEILLLLMIRVLYDVDIFSNIWLWMTFIVSITLQMIVIYSPLGELFEIVPLTFYQLFWLGFGASLFVIAFFVYRFVDMIYESRH